MPHWISVDENTFSFVSFQFLFALDSWSGVRMQGAQPRWLAQGSAQSESPAKVVVWFLFERMSDFESLCAPAPGKSDENTDARPLCWLVFPDKKRIAGRHSFLLAEFN